MISFELEICDYLKIPSIPKKKWDKESAFDKGVAIIEGMTGEHMYAVCRFNPSIDEHPTITKVFSQEPFGAIKEIFLVPSYMDENVDDWDLDDDSKDAAKNLIDEVNEMTNEKEDEGMGELKKLNEWVFDEIHNRDEAEAWLRNYNKKNRIGGKVPKNEETIKMRLMAIYSEMNNKNNKK